MIPAVPGEPITDEELNVLFTALRKRMESGRRKYKGSFTEVDLRQDLLEEALDIANYGLLMAARILRLESFEGPSSNEWHERWSAGV